MTPAFLLLMSFHILHFTSSFWQYFIIEASLSLICTLALLLHAVFTSFTTSASFAIITSWRFYARKLCRWRYLAFDFIFEFRIDIIWCFDTLLTFIYNCLRWLDFFRAGRATHGRAISHVPTRPYYLPFITFAYSLTKCFQPFQYWLVKLFDYFI
jgi:hypothetical protein